MKLNRKIALFLGAAAICSGLFSEAEAAKIDNFKNILLSGSYTIKYDNITPPKRPYQSGQNAAFRQQRYGCR